MIQDPQINHLFFEILKKQHENIILKLFDLI